MINHAALVRRALALVLPAAGLVLAVGCAAPVIPGSAAPVTSAVSAPAAGPTFGPATGNGAEAAVLPASRPVRLTIPSIAVDTELIDLGLQPDGAMEVPTDGATAGWYTESPTPGELGPAVLAAHVDWQGAKGVFYDLRRAQPGDQVTVDRADGQTATFAVRRVEQYPRTASRRRKGHGDVDSAQLRLITCGGDFDDQARSYRDNIVVYAELVTSRP